MAAVPAEFREMPTAPTVTRAEVAALIGTRLGRLIEAAPKRVAAVATDVRTHWAAPWILPVTQAGVMEIQPNHTFQPAALVRRDNLAQIVGQLLALAAAEPSGGAGEVAGGPAEVCGSRRPATCSTARPRWRSRRAR